MRVQHYPFTRHAGVVGLIALVAGLILASATRADTTYIVRKNDTLTRIAASYGVTVSDLVEHNQIARASLIYVGQRLRIPPKNGKSGSELSSSVRRAIASAKVRKGRWKYIVLHHSGTSNGTMKGMDEYHRNTRHMENGLAYHFVIGNGKGMGDGEVGVGKRWTGQINGGHLASESLNEVCIGICLVGNFDKQKPTKKQLASLEDLLRVLRGRCSLSASAVRTHQQINPVYTRCPGRHFPVSTFTQGGSARK